MAKGASFADKSKGKKTKDYTYIKYVKSERSEKTNHWRFNEQMVRLNSGENLDTALKRVEEEVLALDMELPVLEDAVDEYSNGTAAVESIEEQALETVASEEAPEQLVTEALQEKSAVATETPAEESTEPETENKPNEEKSE